MTDASRSSYKRKKESAALNAPRFTVKPLSVTDSFSTISQSLDLVKTYSAKSYYDHYGYAEIVEGVLLLLMP